MKRITLTAAVIAVFASGPLAAMETAPTVKVLAAPADATKKTVLVGRALSEGMIIMFELEPAKAMLMQMGGKWMEHGVGPGERFHVEVKPIDPGSKTRISHADVIFEATNKTTGKTLRADLHPMWGGSGLHYAANHTLAGDGVYEARITVSPPQFARDVKSKNLWMKPAQGSFHFKLANGKLTEVSEPADQTARKK